MRKFSPKYLLLLTLSCLLQACIGPSDPPILSITGVWNIQTINSNINEVSADPLTTNKDLSDQGLFIQFYSNLDFVTNTDLSLTKLLVSEAPLKTGKYNYVVENGVDRIVLQIVDSGINQEVGLNFVVLNMNSNNPILQMNKQDYISSLQESAANLSIEYQEALNTFASRIIDANFTLNCQKN